MLGVSHTTVQNDLGDGGGGKDLPPDKQNAAAMAPDGDMREVGGKDLPPDEAGSVANATSDPDKRGPAPERPQVEDEGVANATSDDPDDTETVKEPFQRNHEASWPAVP